MADMIISGFVGKAIDVAADEILRHIHIALRCKREVEALKSLIDRIQPITKDIQRYRVDLKFGQLQTPPQNAPSAGTSAVNEWLKKLNTHLENARDMAEHCTIPTYNVISRYQLSKKITSVIADIEEHLKDTSLISFLDQCKTLRRIEENQVGQTEALRRIQERLKEGSAASSSSSSAPSLTATASFISAQRRQAVHEPLILGQDDILSTTESLLIGENASRIGVVGMGGSGKTLLLKRLFNSDTVQRHFQDALMIWLTVSQNPSIASLSRGLVKGIAPSSEQSNMSEEDAQRWCHEKLTQRRFVIFFDDVWQGGEDLLEKLGVPVPEAYPHNSKIVVSSREGRVLAKMKVIKKIDMNFLSEDQSWELFSFHAFPENPKNPPVGVIGEIAKRVCRECDRLPLAIKVVGSTMAGVKDPSEWKVALQKLQNAGRLNSSVQQKLFDRIRLSYDALGRDYDPALQLCFVYLGAFGEDARIKVSVAIKLWQGEGLLETENYDSLAIGRAHVNLFLDRCLIQSEKYDKEGQVTLFSMHDVLHDLARQIAENEENCFFKAGKPLNEFPADGSSIRNSIRISLMHTHLQSIPDTFKGTAVRALLLCGNEILKSMPATMIKSLISLRVLDLSYCISLQSLPESLGCMNRLVYLNLSKTRLERLPASVIHLKRLQILDLSYCDELRALPVRLDKLTSLCYLDVSFCDSLESIPSKLSRITSLRFLNTVQHRKRNLWVEREREESRWMSHLRRWEGERTAASGLKDALHSLTNLTHLEFSYFGEDAIREGTLGSMRNMRTLVMHAYEIEALPDDMRSMSQLRSLTLACNALVTIPPWVCDFQQLDSLSLLVCVILKGLPALQKLGRLRHLRLFSCSKLKEFPGEFGKNGAFPALESFTLERMGTLEELPALEEGAMPFLTVLGIDNCPKLKELPERVFNLKNLKKLQVTECPGLAEEAEEGGEH